jgi:hypothetical protein
MFDYSLEIFHKIALVRQIIRPDITNSFVEAPNIRSCHGKARLFFSGGAHTSHSNVKSSPRKREPFHLTIHVGTILSLF